MKLGLVVAAVVGLVLAGVTLSASPRPSPARVQASAEEFRLTLSRGTIVAGRAIVQLVNYGEDDHDLVLRRPGGVARRIGVVHPGDVGELETTLAPGRYVVWCSLADHRARGMQTTLVVRAAR